MCISTSPAVKVLGSPAIDTNLKHAMAASNASLKQAHIDCPRSSGFPITCKLTGVDFVTHKARPVQGTVTVLGVFTKTHTYAYRVLYGPVRGAS